MNSKELRELIEFIVEKDITEFELQRGDVRVRIKRGGEVHYVPAQAPVVLGGQGEPIGGSVGQAAGSAPAAPAAHGVPARPAAESEEQGLHVITSPIVGTFYDAPSPGAPPFVKIGDTVENSQVLCIIEAMKLMNEIESDVAGEIVKKYVNNAQPVEYGQALFAVRARP
jgi:acetyl-CoA carboxylase biotin carboxyl carrier protein